MNMYLKYAALALAALIVMSLVVCGGLVVPARAAGTTYYVDCAAGDDGAAGTSTSTAWRTTTRASQQTYGPGDSILFKRGTACVGDRFQPVGNGTEAEPITIADYGSGDLPVIDGVGANEPAIMLLNVQHYVVRNLNLTQHGQTPQELDVEHGKDKDQNSDEYMRAVLHILGLGTPGDLNCGEACTVRDITLESLEVHDGQWNGIYASGGYYQLDTNTYGYVDGLVIDNVEAWGNHKAGIDVTCTYYQTPIYAARNIQVLDSYLHDNGADGVVLGPVENGLIDGCHTPYNGQVRNARLGAWAWDSLNTTIQFCESDHNMTPLNTGQARDGGGFDLDLGIEDGMIQYSWSHDNEGEGVLLLTWPIGFGYSRGITHNAQMRYNVSERDGYKLAGGITVFGGVDPGVIYNNTIYYVASREAGSDMFQDEGAALTSDLWAGSGAANLKVYNNIFITDGTVNPTAVSYNAWCPSGKGTYDFDHNIWWRVEGGVNFLWKKPVTTWAAWQAKGFDPNGMNVDPQVVGPLGGGPAAYKLQTGSPAIDAGREVTEALRGMGTRDYFGVAIPQNGLYDIGAAEYDSGAPPPTSTPVPPTDTPGPPTDTPVPPTDTPIPPTDTPEPPTATPTEGPSPTPSDTPPPPTDTPIPPTDTPEPPTATPSSNLALNKPVEVSSFESSDFSGDKAVDGDLLTKWRSKKGATDPEEWITVDLQAVYSVSQVVLRWSDHYGTAYAIQVSENGTDWSTVYTTSSGDGGDDVIDFGATNARYVKMLATGFSNPKERLWLNEYEVYQ